MKILALEFSSPQRSVAVVSASEGGAPRRPDPRSVSVRGFAELAPEKAEPVERLRVFGTAGAVSLSEVIETGRGRTMKPLSMIEEALKQAGLEREQIECLAIGTGPGSYTGIRIAISLAQGWQLASGPDGVKLLGISSAECVAAQARAEGIRGRASVVIDAQRGEFYLAGYEIGASGLRETALLRLATFADVCERGQAGEVLVGPEVTRWFPGGRIVFPRAATSGTLALARTDFVAGEKLEPIYLREPGFVKAPPPRSLDSHNLK